MPKSTPSCRGYSRRLPLGIAQLIPPRSSRVSLNSFEVVILLDWHYLQWEIEHCSFLSRTTGFLTSDVTFIPTTNAYPGV